MPQTTTAGPTSAVSSGATNVWTNPDNARVDDATDADAVSTLSLLGTATLIASVFDLLAEEGGSVLTGVKIPAAASVVGVRLSYDVITGGGAPHVLTLSSGPGASTDPFAGTSQTVRTIGYGTLSAGSSVAGGNTFGANNLATDAGALAARASLANGTLVPQAIGGVGSVTTAATYRVDYFRVTVEWVIRADRTGGAKATAKDGGSVKAQVSQVATGGKSPATSGGSVKAQVSRGESGANTTAKAGGSPHPLITQAGGASGSSTAGASAHPSVIAPGGAKATATAGAGVTTVVSFAISGIARDGGSGTPIIIGVRVDVYRTSDHQHMGQDTSDGAGEYAIAVPFTGNEGEFFWSRFFQTGTPNRFATTDEDLELIEAIVQTA